LLFKVNERLSKPELKQYIEKLYGIDVERVNTVRYMGRVKRNIVGAPTVTKNFKKAYVMTSHRIDPILNGIICE
jgi:large subunit ribosomal protein L23